MPTNSPPAGLTSNPLYQEGLAIINYLVEQAEISYPDVVSVEPSGCYYGISVWRVVYYKDDSQVCAWICNNPRLLLMARDGTDAIPPIGSVFWLAEEAAIYALGMMAVIQIRFPDETEPEAEPNLIHKPEVLGHQPTDLSISA